jgi:hypothetical protein
MKKVLFFLLTISCLFASESLFILNSNSLTVSKYDIATEEIDNSFMVLGNGPGAAPNKMIEYDGKIYAVITYENRIQIFSIEDGNEIESIILEDSSTPNDIAISGNFAYVSGNVTNKVYKIDLTTNEVVASQEVGIAPMGLLTYNDKLYVANSGYIMSGGGYDPGSVSVLNCDDLSVVTTVLTDLNSNSLAIVNDKIHVVCTGNYGDVTGNVNVINPIDNSVETTYEIGGSPNSIIFDQDNTVYLGNGYPAGVYAYNAASGSILMTPDDGIFSGGNSFELFANKLVSVDSGDYVNFSDLYIYDLNDNSQITTFEAGVGVTDVLYYTTDVSNEDNVIAINNDIQVYPNPFSGKSRSSINVKFSNEEKQENVKWSVFNIKGQTQISGKAKSVNGEISLPVYNLNNGVYFIKIAGRKINAISKFMIMK